MGLRCNIKNRRVIVIIIYKTHKSDIKIVLLRSLFEVRHPPTLLEVRLRSLTSDVASPLRGASGIAGEVESLGQWSPGAMELSWYTMELSWCGKELSWYAMEWSWYTMELTWPLAPSP